MLRPIHAIANRRWAEFSRDRDGTVALMFGLVVMGLIAASALAIDTSRLNRARSQTSAALDAASLATAKALRVQAVTDAELQQIARAYFDANLRAQRKLDTTYENFTLAIDRERSKADISVDITMPTALGGVFNVSAFRERISSQSVYTARDIELGMMLDVSGSMDGSKIADLRNAAKDLARIVLQDNARGDTTNKIGIAPYSTAVNAGVFARQTTNNPHSSWNTCVTERPGSHAFKDTSPFTAPLGRRSYSCTDSTVLPLTGEISAIENHVNQLDAGGATAGHLGIAWAWYIVSPNWAALWPSGSQPKTYEDPEGLKAVLIMTDGEFNTYFESGNGNSSRQSERLCENMKRAGVKIFTVGFEAPPAALAVLQECATQASYYFDARNGTQLREAFTRIANELTGLRLTQ